MTEDNVSFPLVGIICAYGCNTDMAGLLTAGNIVSVGRQAHKVFLIDVTLEGAQTVRLVDIPQLQLAVSRPVDYSVVSGMICLFYCPKTKAV